MQLQANDPHRRTRLSGAEKMLKVTFREILVWQTGGSQKLDDRFARRPRCNARTHQLAFLSFCAAGRGWLLEHDWLPRQQFSVRKSTSAFIVLKSAA